MCCNHHINIFVKPFQPTQKYNEIYLLLVTSIQEKSFMHIYHIARISYIILARTRKIS